MTTQYLEILVEEDSMKTFLNILLRRLLSENSFKVHAFRSKRALLKRLPKRLSAYKNYLPSGTRIIILVDRDKDNCKVLKKKLEIMAENAGLVTRTKAKGQPWKLVNRIVIEELEAWYFGDWQAVCAAYPRLPENIPGKAPFRQPDAVQGGTWETFERILKEYRYFISGLNKIQVASDIAKHIDPKRNRSHSFKKFYEILEEVRV